MEKPIVFVDGVCVLCHHMLRCVAWLDKSEAFRFAPLQGETAARLLPAEFRQVNTVVLWQTVRGEIKLSTKSEAVLRIMAGLPIPGWIPAFLRWWPTAWRDGLYDFVARLRFRLCGRQDACNLGQGQRLQRRLLP